MVHFETAKIWLRKPQAGGARPYARQSRAALTRKELGARAGADDT